jgi:single-strand DNA-binding protein
MEGSNIVSIECAFSGSLARDAEVKTSKAGKQYLRLNVRVENGEAAQFINVMVFDADAIATADRLVKGARIYVEGRLSLDEWTAADGAKRSGLSCMSWHCRLSQIGRNKPKRENQTPATAPYTPGGAVPFNDDIPFSPEVR